MLKIKLNIITLLFRCIFLSVVFLLDDQEFIWIWDLILLCQLLGRETVNIGYTRQRKTKICGAYKKTHTNNVNRTP